MVRPVSFLGVFLLLTTVSFTRSVDRWKTLSDADIQKISEQWEEDEEDEQAMEPPTVPGAEPYPEPEDDDPLKLSSSDRPTMIRVTLSGPPRSRRDTEDITKLWQVGLLNANIPTERYYVNEKDVIYMTQRGENAVEIKNFLVKQPECLSVRLGNNEYPCEQSKKEEL